MFKKYFGCFLVITALAGVLCDRELDAMELECVQEYNLDAAEVAKFGFFDHIPLDNEVMLKMEDCWTKKANVFDSNGNMDIAVIKHELENYAESLNTPEKTDEKALAELYLSKMGICAAQTFEGASNAEIGLKFHNCVVNEMSKY